ncbi:hypothetical protein [Pseudazoarcus pumilus]|uniref:Cathelicidin antimicrobial peptide C-terminal domain-containing protein n=1 Tax=Pseudazoarcus pumilus TaxID=2067960 RepID=A0A2I6SA60_9RHOO|nr:hypothetical protein [Pseudazoarcus pumilus]AUN96125.1 hypothetical protein C0099_14955 [Pseudazoarcus pumilus]
MKPGNTLRITTLLLAATMLAGLSGCEREGPIERAGKQVDKAADAVGDSLEKAGQKIDDAVRPN